MDYSHIKIIITFTIILSLVSCERFNHCDIDLTKPDINYYSKLSNLFLFDKGVNDQAKYSALLNNTAYKEIFDKMAIKPLKISRDKDLKQVVIVLKKHNTWSMEVDYISLHVSIDGIIQPFEYDLRDNQRKINCQKRITDSMILLSETIYN